MITINMMIAKAIDTSDAKLAGQIANILRNRGENYDNILHRVQSVRPAVTVDEWDALMYEADTDDA